MAHNLDNIKNQIQAILEGYEHLVENENLIKFTSVLLGLNDTGHRSQNKTSELNKAIKNQVKEQQRELKKIQKFYDFFETQKEKFLARELLFQVDPNSEYNETENSPKDHVLPPLVPLEGYEGVLYHGEEYQVSRVAEQNLIEAVTNSLTDLINTLNQGIECNRPASGRPTKQSRSMYIQHIFVAIECLLNIKVQRTNHPCLSTDILSFAVALFDDRIRNEVVMWEDDEINFYELLSYLYDDFVNILLLENLYLHYECPDLFLRHIKRTSFEQDVLSRR